MRYYVDIYSKIISDRCAKKSANLRDMSLLGASILILHGFSRGVKRECPTLGTPQFEKNINSYI